MDILNMAHKSNQTIRVTKKFKNINEILITRWRLIWQPNSKQIF